MRRGWSIGLFIAVLTGLVPSVQAADTTGVTKDTIKIGLFGPLSGQNASFAKGLYGILAIYKDVNDRGGINGRKLELIVEDDACDGDKIITAVKKLADDSKVFMLHGGWCSSSVIKARPEIEKRVGVPYMNIASASAAISTPLAKNIFQPAPTSKTIGETLVNFALTKPGRQRADLRLKARRGSKRHVGHGLDIASLPFS